jgi:hypothetical protein
MILFTPDGHISIPEAIKRLFLRLHPDEKLHLQIHGGDLGKLAVEYERAAVAYSEARGEEKLPKPENRSSYRAGKAVAEICQALGDGLLTAVDGQGLRASTDYWGFDFGMPENPCIKTLGSGKIGDTPVFIEEAAFDRWLNASYPLGSEPTMDNKASVANTNTVPRPTRKSTRKEPSYFPALRKFIAQQCRDSSFAGLAMKTKAERFKKWLTNNDARVVSQLPSTRQQLEASIKKCEAEAPQASRK